MKYSIKLKTFQVSESPSPFPDPCTNPRTAETVLRTIFNTLDVDIESFLILALNAKGRIIGYKIIGQGTVSACLAGPREVLRSALVLGACSILVSHNHPSGDPSPSREDGLLTRNLRAGCEAIGIPLADHIILGRDEFYSFRSRENWDSK
jgi:DNA repair protein RadC